MVGGVARRRHRFQRPPLTFDGVAVLDLDVGPKIAVGAGFRTVLLALEARPRGAMRPLGINRRAGGGLDPRGVRRMVAMGMGDQDMRHGLAAHGIQQRFGMRFVVGTGIDDRDLALAHDVTDRAGESERARIVAEHPPHAGARFVDDARLQREVAVERDVFVRRPWGLPAFFRFRHARPCAGHPRLGGKASRGMAGSSPAMTTHGIMRAPARRSRRVYENA